MGNEGDCVKRSVTNDSSAGWPISAAVGHRLPGIATARISCNRIVAMVQSEFHRPQVGLLGIRDAGLARRRQSPQ